MRAFVCALHDYRLDEVEKERGGRLALRLRVARNQANRAILSRWHLLDLPGADLGVTIDVANQARVHLWYPAHFGYDYAALMSEEDGTRRFLVRETRAGMADVERQRALSATRIMR